MQNKHRDRALLESPMAKMILERLLVSQGMDYVEVSEDINDSGGRSSSKYADIAPWSDGRIQAFEKDPSPRAIANHVAVHMTQALRDSANFNGEVQDPFNVLPTANLAFQIEKLSGEFQLSRPAGVTNSEAFIRSCITKDKAKEGSFDSLNFTSKNGKTMTGKELSSLANKALEADLSANEKMYAEEATASRRGR